MALPFVAQSSDACGYKATKQQIICLVSVEFFQASSLQQSSRPQRNAAASGKSGTSVTIVERERAAQIDCTALILEEQMYCVCFE